MNQDHVLDIDKGVLVSDRSAIANAFSRARISDRPIVIHFHGGLVSRDSALADAPMVQSFYEEDGAYPIIPIWKTGAWDVAKDIWVKIAAEALFKVLVDRVTGFVHAQMTDFRAGNRSPSLQRTLDKVTADEMAKSSKGTGDFRLEFLGFDPNDVRGDTQLTLTPFQENSIEIAVSQDKELREVADAVLRGSVDAPEAATRSVGQASTGQTIESVADPEVLQALRLDAETRSLSLVIAKTVATIVVRVIKRFVSRSDHGLHATVVEEVLRRFYCGAIGTAAWSRMKEYTSLGFAPGVTAAAGTALVEELRLIPAGQRVMLVGHSAGSIFICQLFKHLNSSDRRYEVVLVAPAATAGLFAEAMVARSSLVDATATVTNPENRVPLRLSATGALCRIRVLRLSAWASEQKEEL